MNPLAQSSRAQDPSLTRRALGAFAWRSPQVIDLPEEALELVSDPTSSVAANDPAWDVTLAEIDFLLLALDRKNDLALDQETMQLLGGLSWHGNAPSASALVGENVQEMPSFPGPVEITLLCDQASESDRFELLLQTTVYELSWHLESQWARAS
jgi:hypothetical protein